MRTRNWLWIASVWTLLLTPGCGGASPPLTLDSDDTGTGPFEDSDSATGDDTVTATEGDSETDDEPASAGEPCYTDTWSPSHPNFGLPDCAPGLVCIGNDSQAFCSDTCSLEGERNELPGGLNGWCCGSPFDPCAAKLYWLPEELSAFCIPRVVGLGQECDRSLEWTGEERRCAPLCEEDESLIAVCAEPTSGTKLCTFACDILNGDADCALRPEFQDGCCKEAMGEHFCLTADLCD